MIVHEEWPLVITVRIMAAVMICCLSYIVPGCSSLGGSVAMLADLKKFYWYTRYSLSSSVFMSFWLHPWKVRCQFSSLPSFIIILLLLFLLLLLLLLMVGAVCVMAHAGKSENNFLELVLSFHYVGSRDQTQVIFLARQVPLPTEPSHCLSFIFFY